MNLQGVGVGVEASLLNKGDEVLVPTSSHASDPDPEAVGSELCDKCIAIGAMARQLKTARCSSLTSSQVCGRGHEGR